MVPDATLLFVGLDALCLLLYLARRRRRRRARRPVSPCVIPLPTLRDLEQHYMESTTRNEQTP